MPVIDSNSPSNTKWWTRIGPALITACVVIGPGSIITSSKIGANEQFALLWVVVLSVGFMLLFMTLGAKLGVVADSTPCDLLRRKAGSWLSVLVGLSVFFIATAFQAGNNMAVGAVFGAYVDSQTLEISLIVVFNVLAIAFLFFKNMYRILERLMMTLVGLMLICFAVNLLLLEPDPVKMAGGLIPSLGRTGDTVTVLGLVGTTFVVAAAFYQAYLVRQKGWTTADIKSGLLDARVGAVVMGVLTIILMSTAGAGLYTGDDVSLSNPIDVANSLTPAFGTAGRFVFCLGLFSAAYSSFLVNSMVGGFMASDGLGWGIRPTDWGPRLLTTLTLLTGMSVGIATIRLGFDSTPAIILAQALTVIASPLLAAVLIWLTDSEEVMGVHANKLPVKVLSRAGLVMLLVLACKTAFVDLPAKIQKYRATDSAVEQPADSHVSDSKESAN